MRLNFSGVGEDDIREGIRLIGEVVREQVDLYGTLTGAARRPVPRRDPVRAEPVVPAAPDAPEAPAETAHILPLRRKRA
jgi:hypothetical protein